MLRLICLFGAGLAAGGLLPAQGSQNNSTFRGDGYCYFSVDRPPRASMAEELSIGGGAEGILDKGIGIGLDLAYMFPRGYIGSGIGLVSVNGAYYIVNQRLAGGSLVPFVTGGYSLAFRSGHAHLYNLGLGASYWFHRRVGFRFEFRDFRSRAYGNFAETLRFGLAFK